MSEDHDLLIELKTDVKYIKESIDTYNKRISRLERWQAIVVGISVIASLIVSEIFAHNWGKP